MSLRKNAAAVLFTAAAIAAAPVSEARSLTVQTLNVNTGTQAARLAVSKTCTTGNATVPDGTPSVQWFSLSLGCK